MVSLKTAAHAGEGRRGPRVGRAYFQKLPVACHSVICCVVLIWCNVTAPCERQNLKDLQTACQVFVCAPTSVEGMVKVKQGSLFKYRDPGVFLRLKRKTFMVASLWRNGRM